MIQNNLKDAETFYDSGLSFSEKGELESAIADYTQAIKHNPNYIQAHYNRGNAY